MNIKLIIIFFCFFLTNYLFSDIPHIYNSVDIKIVNAGNNNGEIGWQRPVAGRPYGPSCITISFDNRIYVPDRVNKRINIYSLEGDYIKSIKEKNVRSENEAYYSNLLKIDYEGNIIALSNGLRKINQSGIEIYFINRKDLPEKVTQQYNFFPVNSDVFIYDDKDEIACITEKGQIVRSTEAQRRLKSHSGTNKRSAIPDTITLPEDKKVTIDNLATNSKYIIIDDDFFSSEYQKTDEYYEKIKDIRTFVQAQKKVEQKKIGITSDVSDIDFNMWGMSLIGYDDEHNGYWRGIEPGSTQGFDKEAIVVFSRYGELLDVFYYGQYTDNKPNFDKFPTTDAKVAVAPNGDVYFMSGNEKEYTFYKIPRQW